MKKLYLYTVFHLNLAYSSISEKDYPLVIKRSYWPLFNICDKMNVSPGIEASGYTLEKIQEVCPSLISKWKELLRSKKCEFIGSGYAQLIGPLVPSEVNSHNLNIGNQIYQEILGQKPEIAYVSEQTYSRGLVEHHLDAGYKAIVAEWNNPWRFHSEWEKEWRYSPQVVLGQGKKKMPLIWNDSIAFQKFQKYAQGEIELDEYLEYLQSHLGNAARFFPLYGSDIEIFDFRPGRYGTEAKMDKKGEWSRIEKLFKELSASPSFEIVAPSKVLELAKRKNAFNRIRLESPEQPIPVKKQEKYNIARWAVTGPDDLAINTKCYKIYNALNRLDGNGEGIVKKRYFEEKNKIELWKELCFLWSSDFRTHIEKNRFRAFQKRLNKIFAITTALANEFDEKSRSEIIGKKRDKLPPQAQKPIIKRDGDLIAIETERLKLILNRRRGLSIHSLVFKKISKKPLIGALPHGYYDDISFSADFYTGHTIMEIPMKHKITDLNTISKYALLTNQEYISVKADVKTDLGIIHKTILIFTKKDRIGLEYEFDFKKFPLASFRSGIITFNPEIFDSDSLYYSCHNGGKEKEIFYLKGVKPITIEPLSLLISSKQLLGNTEGVLEVGDKQKSLILNVDMEKLAILPMINFIPFKDTFFLRVLFSLGEIDDTSLITGQKKKIQLGFRISIIARKNS